MNTFADRDDLWPWFQVAFVEAITRIGEAYFSVPRITGDITWSERPYCYELFHQLRCQLGNG